MTTFNDFDDAREAANAAKLAISGGDNFPGLGKYDRVYAIPDDGYGWPCCVIVRASALHRSSVKSDLVTVFLHSFRRNVEQLKWEDMTPQQLEAVADIKRLAARWVNGEIDRLPPSNDRHWSPRDEL